MQSNVTLGAKGLYTQPNILDVPGGAMTVASNVVIQREDVVEPRRGFKLFGTLFGTSTDRLKQVFSYKNRILRHFASTLQYDTGTLTNSGEALFSSFSGSVVEPQAGLRIKSAESNGNFYFTSSSGIKKISALSASEFTTGPNYVTGAGGVKALDLESRILYKQGDASGFLPQDSAVAYRVVWGITDSNNNLILGTPSQRSEVYNNFINTLLLDYNTYLNAIQNVADNGLSLIDDSDYVSVLGLPNSASATTLYGNLISLSSKLDNNIVLARDTAGEPLVITGVSIANEVCTITFTGDPSNYLLIGSNIFVSGFPATLQSGSINTPTDETTVVTAVTSNSISFATTATATNKDFTPSAVGVKISQNFVQADVNINSGTPPSTITINNHGFASGSPVTFSSDGTLPAPLVAGSTYYLGNVTTNTFQVYADSGLTALIPITTTGTLSGGQFHSVSSSNTNKITINSHGYSTGNPVRFTTTGTLPSPLAINTTYYIGNVTTNTFQIFTDAALSSVVNLTTTGSGVSNIAYYVPVTSTQIRSNEFGSIPQPVEPATNPTNDDLLALQTYLEAINSKLLALPTTNGVGFLPIINAASKTNYLAPLTPTTTVNVALTITVPQGLNTNYFYQIYRSSVTQATGVATLSDLIPTDEMQLVQEDAITDAQILAGVILFTDTSPDSLRGANLYTNPSSGEGIANANEPPPLALDINRFKNVLFFANTRTQYRQIMSLLGVSNMITDYGNGIIPKLTISNGTVTNTYSFIEGRQQVTQFTAVADVAGNLAGKYFLINSANNNNLYYVWYAVAGTSGTDPEVSGRTGIKVYFNVNDTAAVIAEKTTNSLIAAAGFDFTIVNTSPSAVFTVTTVDQGYTAVSTVGTSGFSLTTAQTGQGQNVSLKQILLSSSVSPAIAIDQTARSLVQVINQNPDESVYAYYISGSGTVPGRFVLESRDINSAQFYILGNNANTGSSFNPNIAPTSTITSITTGANPVITTAIPHGLVTGDQIMLSATNSTPSVDGLYTINYVSPTSFSILLTVTVAGTSGSWISANNGIAGSNEAKINRIYYSKFQQPESVPIANYFDVGAADQAILRIFPLRDSLFVFKEDGLYRISGETAPFNLALFDSSCVCTAPDSVSVAKNIIYAWTTQGVVSITESGISNPPVSRPIDTDILKLGSANFPNFDTATWGVGYESDNSYIVFTVKDISDTQATIGYRYSTLTNTWTTLDKTNTCGTVNVADDKLYMGAGDTNYLEQERKTFTRFDYADRELDDEILDTNYNAGTFRLPSVSGLAVGDSVVQTQLLTTYEFNSLLRKLDLDAGLYSSTVATIGIGVSPLVTTATNHNMVTGDYVAITGTNCVPSVNGTYQITYVSANQFTITPSVPVTIGGTGGLAKYSYAATLRISSGVNLVNAINKLTARLNIDPGTVYKASSGSVVSNSVATSSVVTTSSPHNLGPVGFIRKVRVAGVAGSSPSINGDYDITVTGPSTFTVPVTVISGGTGGSFSTLDDYVTATGAFAGTITGISQTNPAVLTAPSHGMVSNRYVVISASNSTPTVDGNYTINVLGSNSFSVPVSVTVSGNTASYQTLTNDFKDIQTNFNYIATTLNNDPGLAFKNYQLVTTPTSQEAIITNINLASKLVTLNLDLEYVVGPIKIFKAIDSIVVYAPVTFKDALNLKQVAEATLMFENKAFTNATLSFASDLLPKFNAIPFNGDGNGAFGVGTGKFGGKFFGGGANAAPFRTYIPRDNQRCRYIVAKFQHKVALEKYAINGLTLTGTLQQSSRAYR